MLDRTILFDQHNAIRFRSHPEIRATVFEQVDNSPAVQSRHTGFIKNAEAGSVETDQAIEGCEPKVSFLALHHREHHARWEVQFAGTRWKFANDVRRIGKSEIIGCG